MLKLAKELLLSVMEKFMAEILDSLVEATRPAGNGGQTAKKA